MITVVFEKMLGKYHTFTQYGDDVPPKDCVEFDKAICAAKDALNGDESTWFDEDEYPYASRVITYKEDINARKV